MSHSTIKVEHVRVTADKPFEKFTVALEQQLGRFNPAVHDVLVQGDMQTAKAMLESMAGSTGFMLFRTTDHGLYLQLVGKTKKATQYLIGNPLFAIEMTRHAIGAALYAPLRMLVYEIEDRTTCVEYDLPSSLFGQFRDEAVEKMAISLDQKLEAMIGAAS